MNRRYSNWGKRLSALLISCLTVLLASAQTQYNLRDFNGVEVSGFIKVFITQSENYSISVEESRNPNVKTIVEKNGQTLNIYTKVLKKKRVTRDGDSPIVHIAMPRLSNLKAKGAVSMNVESMKTGDFIATISGASKLTVGSMSCGDMTLNCSGASDMKVQKLSCNALQSLLTGASKLTSDIFCKGDMKLNCSGASKQELTIQGQSLNVTNSGASKSIIKFNGGQVEAKNSGAGKMQLAVDCEYLNASNSGASKFIITGTADRTDIDLSGASKIDTSGLNKY
ncbi:MAG: DUF2807 domain-containing protein [Prevotella sp.]|nr:DUF2807 domain-containing protein [Prevotella sp.]